MMIAAAAYYGTLFPLTQHSYTLSAIIIFPLINMGLK